MTASAKHIDKPEPRWQALLALVAIGGIYLAFHRGSSLVPHGCCQL